MTEADTPKSSAGPGPGFNRNAYWRKNLLVMALLLSLWAGVSLGCGILFADTLNAYELPGTGYPLGFWFAQQGSIVVFVLLILAYCLFMNRLDARHHQQWQARQASRTSPTEGGGA
jgi:putative solute:sodium symporter small subunit